MNTSLPNFERLKRTITHKEPDKVPLVELEVDVEIKEAFLGRKIVDIKTDIEFWKSAGYDFYCFSPAKDIFEKLLPGTISYTGTTVGCGFVERKWSAEGEGLITSLEEFKKIPWPEPKDVNYNLLKIIKSELPSDMGLIGRIGGFWEYVWQLMGFEVFCMNLADNKELIDLMFEKVRSIVYGVFKNLMDFDFIDAIWFCDDIAYATGLMVSPDILRYYVFSNYKKMAKICHDRNMPVIYHSDGNLWEVMDDIISTGIDAIHPIEPKAMDIKELKRKIGDKLCLIGNIDLGYTLTRGTPTEVEDEVKQKIRDLAPGGGYCVSSSNTITNYVPIENYRAMINAALKYGSYPICL